MRRMIHACLGIGCAPIEHETKIVKELFTWMLLPPPSRSNKRGQFEGFDAAAQVFPIVEQAAVQTRDDSPRWSRAMDERPVIP
jgi:hypothetical protein